MGWLGKLYPPNTPYFSHRSGDFPENQITNSEEPE